MQKTLLIIIVFIICAVLIAYAFSTLFVTGKNLRYQDCILLQNTKTGAVDCFGCYNDICKDATKDWKPYISQQIGIPYACFKSNQGCQLAQ